MTARAPFFRLLLAGTFLLGAAACDDAEGGGNAAGQEAQDAPDAEQEAFDLSEVGYDRGDPEAPIRIIEFSDFGCVHCQSFHRETYPALHEEFVEEGKVAWKYVPISIAGFPNAEEAALAAKCAGQQDRFFEVAELIYRDAEAWTEADDPDPVLLELGEEAGLGDLDAYGTCVQERRHMEQVQEYSQLASEIGVQGTPTFVINGMPVQGAPPLDAFRQALNDLLEELEAAEG